MGIGPWLASGLYVLGLLFFGLAILLDLVSMLLLVRRLRTGSGASPVPVVSWVIYFLWIVILRDLLGQLRSGGHAPGLLTLRNGRDLALMTLFHLCCHALAPWIYWRWLIRRRASQETIL